MGTTADKLNYLLGTKTAIKDALVAKGVNIDDSAPFRTYADKIEEIPIGGISVGTAPVNDVNFYDCDGTILYSCSKSAFLALTEMPELPTRKGLICQGWNWDFESAKDYISNYGKLEVGATYITDDGNTRLYINIPSSGRMNVPLFFAQDRSNGVVVDWGDGSATETKSDTNSSGSTITHQYASPGDYCITLTPMSGTLTLRGGSKNSILGANVTNTCYANMLKRVELGSNVMLGSSAFKLCSSLLSVTMPNSITYIPPQIFYGCYSLMSAIIPRNTTLIQGNAFEKCQSLKSVSLSKNAQYEGSVFSSCYSLDRVTFASSGNVIPANAFTGCYALKLIVIPNNITNIANLAFSGCYSLGYMILPNNVSSIGNYAFNSCYSLVSVIIPSAMTQINQSSFYECKSLTSVKFGSAVGNILSSAYANCYSVGIYDFRNHTSVPSLTSGAFANIPTDCKIVVPDSLYDSWIAAANWSTYASQIVKASEYNG